MAVCQIEKFIINVYASWGLKNVFNAARSRNNYFPFHFYFGATIRSKGGFFNFTWAHYVSLIFIISYIIISIMFWQSIPRYFIAFKCKMNFLESIFFSRNFLTSQRAWFENRCSFKPVWSTDPKTDISFKIGGTVLGIFISQITKKKNDFSNISTFVYPKISLFDRQFWSKRNF